MCDGYHSTENEEKEELIKTIGKETENQSRNHLSSLHTVEQASDHPAEQHRQWRSDQRADKHARDAVNAGEYGEKQTDLPRHRTDDETEVKSKSCQYRHKQCQYKEAVASKTFKNAASNHSQR